ncbi:MAG: hypothetical protein M3Q29_03365 [Chloroflexota bacterium]|nr:hypothetical protein [Chloroflexota bacterium]
MDEGGSVVVTASGTDPEGATLTYAWDLDNNGTFETSGQSTTVSAQSIDGPASRTIKARVTDLGGLSSRIPLRSESRTSRRRLRSSPRFRRRRQRHQPLVE